MSPSCPSRQAAARSRLEVAEVFRAHGVAFRKSHCLGTEQRKAMWAIEHCRTEVLGGHLDVCLGCGTVEPSYNSCRNRHCPKCQALRQAAWLEQRKQRILPTHYFHVVFTLPSELRALARRNPRALYDLLFSCASRTLLDFGRNNLGAQLGVTAVLHTWTRDLRLHPHLHCVVTGGGLDGPNARWVSTSKRFLFPIRALANCFRAKVLHRLRALRQAGSLVFNGAGADFADDAAFRRLCDRIFAKNWIVYAKRPFGGPEQVFEYLGRYTHRVALSNARLVHVDDEQVRFRTRDGKHASLPPARFIGRYLLHVLPHAFVKIRHYGLKASSNATTKLETARARLLEQAAPQSPLLAVAPRKLAPLDWRVQLALWTGIDVSLCARCGGMRVRRGLDTLTLAPGATPRALDTS